MKKSLLILAAGFVAVSASADALKLCTSTGNMMGKQEVVPVANFSMVSEPAQMVSKNAVAPTATVCDKMDETLAGPRRSVADGVYYVVDSGFMFRTFDASGSGYGADILLSPAYTSLKFTDQSKKYKDTKWTIGTNSLDEYLSSDHKSFEIALTPSQEGYFYNVPSIANGTSSYQIGEEGNYYKQGHTTRMSTTTDITPMSFVTDHSAQYQYYGWSRWNNSHYLFGYGSTTDDSTNVTENFVGCEEFFPAPMSPLYVESVDVPCYSFTKTPMADGAALTMSIYVGESEEPIVLTATAENFSIDQQQDGSDYSFTTDYGELYVANLHFSIKTVDVFGTEMEAPFVLDDSCTVVISGFENVKLGFGSCQNQDPYLLPSAGIITDQDHEYHYQSELRFAVTFNAMFDMVMNAGDVVSTDGDTLPSWYVCIASDGLSFANGIFNDIDGALFYTASTWTSEEGDDHYTAINTPDWITETIATYYGKELQEGDIESTYSVGFHAEKLPEGVASRGQFVFIEGRGYTCEDPIFVFQLSDNATQDDLNAAWNMAVAQLEEFTGITAVSAKATADNKTYNLFGQTVDGNYKGIVVVNGVKQIRK